jgi:hypothetical protein
MMSFSGSLRSHEAPVPPELLDDVELPDEPDDPDEPDVPEEPDVPDVPDDDVVEPVSGFAESAVPASVAEVVVLGGSFVLLSGGVGSADFVSSVVAPWPSSGDVAHAEMRATSDRAATGMRAKRRMAGTLAAELCGALACLHGETLR